jgi:hypothetical protein
MKAESYKGGRKPDLYMYEYRSGFDVKKDGPREQKARSVKIRIRMMFRSEWERK